MMQFVSPAKINLHLRIGPIAADGFHPLLSWMCTVGLHDMLDIKPSDQAGIRLTCDRRDIPTDEKNLIVRAGRLLSRSGGAEVNLHKRIPMGGGLGGGSSNGAIALIAFNQLWNLHLTTQRLAEHAARLGSDVPFFLHGPSSACAGRGQHVTPIPAPAPRYAVLFFPKLSMPTPAVYRRFDEMKLGSSGAIQNQPDWKTWSQLAARDLLQLLVNDLEAPAFSLCPELGQLRRQIEQEIRQPVRMSGSGSTLFTLADNPDHAGEIVQAFHRPTIETIACELSPPNPNPS